MISETCVASFIALLILKSKKKKNLKRSHFHSTVVCFNTGRVCFRFIFLEKSLAAMVLCHLALRGYTCIPKENDQTQYL